MIDVISKHECGERVTLVSLFGGMVQIGAFWCLMSVLDAVQHTNCSIHKGEKLHHHQKLTLKLIDKLLT